MSNDNSKPSRARLSISYADRRHHKLNVFPKKFRVGDKLHLTKRLVIKRDTAEGRGVFAPRKRKLPSEQNSSIWAKKGDTLTFYGGSVKLPEAKRAKMGPHEGTHYKAIVNSQGLVIDGLEWPFEKQVHIAP